MQTNLGVPLLNGMEALDGLTTTDLREVERHARVVHLRKNESLFVEGDPRSYLFGLVDGRIKMVRLSPRGREFILDFIEPGEVFGESSLFGDAPHDSFAVAFEDSRVVKLPSRELAALAAARPRFALRVAELVELRRTRTERRLVALAFQKVRGRVASLLLQLCRDYGVRGGDGIRIRIRLRQQEMANLLGVSREIVSHTLAEFRREGLIDADGRKLIVRQTLPLERLESFGAHRNEVTS